MIEKITDNSVFPEYREYFNNFAKDVQKGDKSEHTYRSYKYAIDQMIEYFGIESIEDLKSLDAKLLREYRNDAFEDVGNPTINNRFRCLSAFFTFLVDNEYLDKNPLVTLKRLKEEKKVKAILSEDEQNAMIDACDNIHDKAVIVMLLATAARRSELVNIRRKDVSNGHVLIVKGKGQKQRLVPIQKEIEDFLYDYFDRVPGEYVIVSQRGNHQVTPEAVRQTVKRIGEKAGISPERLEEISCHTFRRSVASKLLNNGTENFFVRDFLGHSSSVTTARYAQVRNEAMDQAVLKGQRNILQP